MGQRARRYNHLGQLTQVMDAAGVRTISYNQYGEQESDSLVVDGDTHLITETRDAQGRSTGYVYSKNGATQQTVTTGYGEDGRIATAGFLHGGSEKQFSYEYLPGTHLLQKLTKSNGMSLTQSYEPQRDLLTGMAYHRGSTLVAQRTYTYDTLGRPLSRSTARNGQTVNDTFGYNNRSELATATVNGGSYAYDYDNIGNRKTAQEATEEVTGYTANELNQYTTLSVDGVTDFQPEYDADGNQTRVKTSTGIWAITYDTENRPTDFTSVAADNTITTVHCEYDSMGRRAIKRVMVNGNVTLHQRYIYRGYLQIACIDLTRSHHPALWYITWDPTQQIATRPLALQKDGTWYTYGWDLTKNICEVYRNNGTLGTSYTYTPYGLPSQSTNGAAAGGVEQPIQWSSEFNDTELGLTYYNYRHYNPVDGRWLGRDRLRKNNLYRLYQKWGRSIDVLGLREIDIQIYGYEEPVIKYVEPGKYNAHIEENVLGQINEAPTGAFAITLGYIKFSDLKVKCRKSKNCYKVESINIKSSILILINQVRMSYKYYNLVYGQWMLMKYPIPRIPSDDGKSSANPRQVLQCEMDHFRDLHTWFNSEEIRKELQVEAIEASKSKGINSLSGCSGKVGYQLKKKLVESYNRAAKKSAERYDYGANPPHVLEGNYPNSLDMMIYRSLDNVN